MGKIRVNVNLDEDLNKRWGKIAKKHKMTKSGMIEDFLRTAIPILEKEAPRDVMAHTLQNMGDVLSQLGQVIEEKKK